MGACQRRSVAALFGLTIAFTLLLFKFGNVPSVATGRDWLRNIIPRNSTLSANDKLQSTSAGALDTHTVNDTLQPTSVGAVVSGSNVLNNDTDLTTALPPKPILVLFWTVFFGHRDWYWGEGNSPLGFCPELVGQCEFTSDHSRMRDSDVLLFHMRDSLNLPQHRLARQKWVFSILESPVHTFANLQQLQGLFNLTMTYARTAQVSWVYGLCEPLPPNTISKYNKTFNYAAKKKHLVAWFVSNCRTASRRETYVQVLGKHIDVHKHGCGGKYNCPRSKASACNRRLNDEYKFYLSFENSLCRDYVTEKLWRILELNVVPVVLGNASYSEILPPHSYIDVRDFASPRHLADYLKLLDANDTQYNEYFGWREKYVCGEPDKLSHSAGCNLCRHVVATRGRKEVATDLVAEWSRAKNCFNPKQFYRGMDAYL